MINKIGVAGAGTMGSGIALSCALKGFPVVLFDAFEQSLEKGKQSVQSNLQFLLSKSKITESECIEVMNRIHFTSHLQDCVADLIIEAITEKMEAKIELLGAIAAFNAPTTLLTSNTSSLSIDVLQQQLPQPQRVAGLHFFNPAHVMKLVEVVKGAVTGEEVITSLVAFCRLLDKEPVVCKNAPGFIVNRVARHFYLESMKIAELGVADIASIDSVLEATGFKMGPFKLMDMIGMDINLAVSQSLFDAFGKERFRPSPLQEEKVKKGELGRKTKKGFYTY